MRKKILNSQPHILNPRKIGFTLIEILIVVGVISILASITVLVLKPAELLKEARDSTRIQDIRNIDKTITLGRTQSSSLLSNVLPTIVYLSLPDKNGVLTDDCRNNTDYPDLLALTGSWEYRCRADSTNLQKTNGDGWLPINFTSLPGGGGFSALPIDPRNTAEDNLYYTFSLGTSGTSYSLSANLQSQKYLNQIAATDGGNTTSSFETTPIAWTTTTVSAPTVTTSNATNITSFTAILNGSANPNNDDTTGWFRYGTINPVSCNDTFGTRAPSSGGSSLGSGNIAINYSQGISSLAAGTTYFFCAIAQNSLGASFGNVLSFDTLPSAENRYWVGGVGNWSDTNHWSTSSGGTGGATAPDVDDTAIFDVNSGGGTATLNGAVSIGVLNMATGNTTAINTSASNYSFTASGNFTISAGIFNANGSTITVGGNWDSSGGTGWNAGASTVILSGSGNLAQYATLPYNEGFYNLSAAAATKTTTLTSAQLWVNKLIVGNGIFTGNAIYLQGTGEVFVDGGATITVTNFVYRNASIVSAQNVVGRDYSGITNLYFYGTGGASGSVNYNMQGNITANNILIYINNGTVGWTRNSVLNTNNYSIIASGLTIGSNGDINNYGLLNAGSSSVTINGNVTIYASDTYGNNEINAGSSAWNVSGNWTNNDIFTAGTSIVAFTAGSGASTFTGNTTFERLSCTAPNKQLTFSANSTQTISGTLTLTGAVGNTIKLRSSTTGTRWGFLTGGLQTVNYVDVRDSNVSGNDITANNSVNSGNNDNAELSPHWVFP